MQYTQETFTDKAYKNKAGKIGSTIWGRQCKIPNSKDIDAESLLRQMHSQAKESFKYWTRKASKFKGSHIAFIIAILLLQLAQVIVFQLQTISGSVKSALAVIIPSLTAAVLTMLHKLNWLSKATKSKWCAAFFDKIAKHTGYRLKLMEFGGEVTDSVKIWNAALLGEATEIPPFLMSY